MSLVEDDDYNPYARGEVVEGKDKSGRAAKHQTHACHFTVSGTGIADGHHSLPYAFLTSMPWMSPDKTEIEFLCSGKARTERGWEDAEWLVSVKGKRLETVFNHLNEARRLEIHQSHGTEGSEAQVDEVTVTEWDG